MGVFISGTYLGHKKMSLVHEDSQVVLTTAAPKDNNGDGSSFSPTDLLTGSLGACMMTIIGIVAERDGVDLAGSYFRAEKIMSQSPRRVGEIIIELHLPQHLTPEHRRKYEQAAQTCPVHHSLHPEITVSLSYHYDR
jgi:putative redox protein